MYFSIPHRQPVNLIKENHLNISGVHVFLVKLLRTLSRREPWPWSNNVWPPGEWHESNGALILSAVTSSHILGLSESVSDKVLVYLEGWQSLPQSQPVSDVFTWQTEDKRGTIKSPSLCRIARCGFTVSRKTNAQSGKADSHGSDGVVLRVLGRYCKGFTGRLSVLTSTMFYHCCVISFIQFICSKADTGIFVSLIDVVQDSV